MRKDRARRHVEAALDDEGWSVYLLTLGGGPALVAVWPPSGLTLRVAVGTQLGATYHRFDRARDRTDVLASVDPSGAVTYCDPHSRSTALSLGEMAETLRSGRNGAPVASPGGK